MLLFISREVALSYLLFSFLSALGAVQWVAARNRLDGLAFFDYSRHATFGYVLGGLLIVGSAVWFFLSQWTLIFAPGPAGAELTLLFGAGFLCALLATAVLAALLKPLRDRVASQSIAEPPEAVALGSTTGHLYTPREPRAPMPAICMVPRPGSSARELAALIRGMLQEGIAVLVINPKGASFAYPEVMALLPAATALLGKRPDIDAHRIGVLGHDLGADLVMRAASADKDFKAVAALAPVLAEASVGLDLLREMPYPQALCWAASRRRAKLRSELNSAEYAPKIAPRPLLLLYGADDPLASAGSPEKWETRHKSVTLGVMQGAGHLSLVSDPTAVQTVIQWFKEHL